MMAENIPHNRIDSIGDIERKNSRAGQHFFDAGTLRFFNSRIQDVVIKHRFFITTEKQGDEYARRATIRMICDDGSTCDVGEFQEFATPGAAEKALSKALKAGVTVKNDPYDGVADPTNAKAFNWRPYMGELPIGLRNTKWKAQRLGAQAKRPAYL